MKRLQVKSVELNTSDKKLVERRWPEQRKDELIPVVKSVDPLLMVPKLKSKEPIFEPFTEATTKVIIELFLWIFKSLRLLAYPSLSYDFLFVHTHGMTFFFEKEPLFTDQETWTSCATIFKHMTSLWTKQAK